MRLSCVHVFAVLLIRNFCVSQNFNFHQDDSDIRQDKINILAFNKTAAPILTATLFIYNDTLKMKAINLTVHAIRGVQRHIFLTFASYKYVQNVYRKLPVPNVTLDLCEEYPKLGDKNPFGIQSALKASNFRGCPAAPGIYYMHNFILQDDKFPPHMLVGEFMVTIGAAVDDNTFIADAEWYGAVIRRKKK